MCNAIPFQSSAAPNLGGLLECAVGSAKHQLRRVMGETIFTLEEFYTVITQVEALLNSRPTTLLSIILDLQHFFRMIALTQRH